MILSPIWLSCLNPSSCVWQWLHPWDTQKLVTVLIFVDCTMALLQLLFAFPWRIHGAAIYGVPWIPSIYPSHVSIDTIHGTVMGLDTQFWSILSHAFFLLCWPIMRNMSLLVITADPHAKVVYLGTVEASYSWFLSSAQHVNSQIQPSAKMFQCGFQHVHATKLQAWCVSNNHNFNPRFLLISTPKGPYHTILGSLVVSSYTCPLNPHGEFSIPINLHDFCRFNFIVCYCCSHTPLPIIWTS